MNFFRRLFGRDDKFYDLLESSADEAKHSACILAELMPHLDDKASIQASLETLAQSRRKHKRISQEITTQLCRTFVTPLEREDIEALSNALSRVPKTMEKIGERLLICPLNNHAESMIKHVAMLEQAAATVAVMVHSLRTNPHV